MTEENKKENTENKAEEAKQEAPKEEPKAEAKPEAEEKKPEAKKEEKKPEAKKEEAKVEEKKTEAKAPKVDKKPAPKGKDNKDAAPGDERGDRRGPRGKGKRGEGRGRGRGTDKEPGSDFTEKVIQVRRVTKVVKGGKKLSFRAVVVIGNEKGKVGVGVGKASEVVNAIKKAVTDARKSLIDVKMLGATIPHTITGFAGGSEVFMKPAAEGTGIIAGGAARAVLELSGLGDILSKSKGSRSPLNVARATLEGLKNLRTFKEVAKVRGLSLKEMLS